MEPYVIGKVICVKEKAPEKGEFYVNKFGKISQKLEHNTSSKSRKRLIVKFEIREGYRP